MKWKLVPPEATPEMIQAANSTPADHIGIQRFADVYRAMIAAAPDAGTIPDTENTASSAELFIELGASADDAQAMQAQVERLAGATLELVSCVACDDPEGAKMCARPNCPSPYSLPDGDGERS